MSFLAPLAAGYSAEQVFSFLAGSFPYLGKRLRQARHMGHDVQSILKSLNGLDKKKLKHLDEQARNNPSMGFDPLTESMQATERSSAKGQIQQAGKTFGKAALATGAGYLAGRALENVPFGKIGQKIGQSLGYQGPKTVNQEPVAEAMGSNQANGEQVPVTPSVEVAKGLPKSSINDLKVDFEKLQLGQKIEKLVATRPPEVLGGILDKQISSEQKQELEEKYGRTFPELIKDYADNYLQKAQKSPLSQESLTHQRNVANQDLPVGSDKNIDQDDSTGFKGAFASLKQGGTTDQLYEGIFQSLKEGKPTYAGIRDPLLVKAEPLFKKGLINSLQDLRDLYEGKLNENTPTHKKESQKNVALPDGRIGEIQEERQGIATVKLPDGTISRRKTSDLAHEPVQLEKQITDLIEAIPEDERSAVLAFASYNPGQEFEFEGKKHNIPFMGVQFHNGDFYMYPGVSKQQFDKVVSKATKAKTTGDNPWHAWTEGKESRGAGMYELIKELEKNFGKNFIKLKAGEGYDYFKRIRQVIKDIETRKKRKQS